jgi:ribosome biogenesis protein ENP2
MHGYFMSLKLYDAARVIANPFAYAEYRDKLVREKMEKLAEGRIRTKEVASGVKVNKALAEKIQREEERQRRKEERQKKRRDERADVAMEIEETPEADADTKPTLLNDPRFKRLFEDPEFAVDEESREYALMNPSAVTQRQTWKDGRPARTKTAVEEEEEESDKSSSDGLGESGSNESGHESGSDSSDAGGTHFLLSIVVFRAILINFFFYQELNRFDPRARPGQKNPRAQEAYARNRERNRLANISLVPARPQMNAGGSSRASDKNATFGERRTTRPDGREGRQSDGFGRVENGGMETSWVPSAQSAPGVDERINAPRKKEKRKGVKTFAAGFERGGEGISAELSESQRKGRTQRRKGVRSGSKNVFRRMK